MNNTLKDLLYLLSILICAGLLVYYMFDYDLKWVLNTYSSMYFGTVFGYFYHKRK